MGSAPAACGAGPVSKRDAGVQEPALQILPGSRPVFSLSGRAQQDARRNALKLFDVRCGTVFDDDPSRTEIGSVQITTHEEGSVTAVALAIIPTGMDQNSTGSADAGAPRHMADEERSAFETALRKARDERTGVITDDGRSTGLEAPSKPFEASALLLALGSQASLAASSPPVSDSDPRTPGTEDPAASGQEIEAILASRASRPDSADDANHAGPAAMPPVAGADPHPHGTSGPADPPEEKAPDAATAIAAARETGGVPDHHARIFGASGKSLVRERPDQALAEPAEHAQTETGMQRQETAPDDRQTIPVPGPVHAEARSEKRSNRPSDRPEVRTDGPASIETGEAGPNDDGPPPEPLRLSGLERSSFVQRSRDSRDATTTGTASRAARADGSPVPKSAGSAVPPHGLIAAPWESSAPSGLREAGASRAAEPSPVVLLPLEEPPKAPPLSALSVEVTPPETGPVRIRVVLHDRTVHANISSEHPDLRLFLLDHQDRLGDDLRKHGLELGHFHVMPEDRHGRRDDLRQFSDGRAGRHGRDVAPDPPAEGVSPLPRWDRAQAVSLFA